MPGTHQHPLLKSSAGFDLPKVEAAYAFSRDLPNLHHRGLSKKAGPYESVLTGSLASAYEARIRKTEELTTFYGRVVTNVRQELKTAITDLRFQPGSGEAKRFKVMASFDRVLVIMNMTMSIVLQLPSVKKELKTLRANRSLFSINLLRSRICDDAPVLGSVSTLRDETRGNLKTALVIAHHLCLDIGEHARYHLALEKEE